jgi:glycerophosphoryl diester phosphodiesterase
MEAGANFIELDVRSTNDGQLAVFHDSSLHRLFGLDKQVRNCSIGELKDVSMAGGREIPTLDEVLQSIKSNLVLDLKERGLESQIINKIKNFSNDVLISSIYPGVLKKIRTLDENVKLGLILGRGESLLLPVFLRLFAKKLHLYSIHLKYPLVNKSSLALTRSNGIKIFVWTVNKPEEFERMTKLGVDGIFTDFPENFINKSTNH